jgi:DNA invertase Pin-like site-specific DNA recombinase
MPVIAAYVRVSTVGQNEAGQRKAIKAWIASHYPNAQVKWFIDKESGDNLNRPAFERLQREIFSGKAKVVVVFKLDRLSRSLRDGITTLCDWCDKGIRIVSTSQQIDFNGTIGKLIASVLFAVAEMEQETRRERQALGIQTAKERGVYKGRQLGSTVAKPERAVELRKKGLNDGEIAKQLGVTRRTVQRYLRICGS